MTDIEAFLDALASSEPVPGGGSVAALNLAMGAALTSMVCGLTLGREKYAAVASTVQEIERQSEVIHRRALALMEEDVAAFTRVSESMKLPRGSDEEKAARRAALQSALKGAVEPPLETMRQAQAAMDLAVRLAPVGNTSAISDVGSGALCLEAAFQSAKLNVEINLALIKDAEYLERIRTELPPDHLIRQAKESVLRDVYDTIAPPS